MLPFLYSSTKKRLLDVREAQSLVGVNIGRTFLVWGDVTCSNLRFCTRVRLPEPAMV